MKRALLFLALACLAAPTIAAASQSSDEQAVSSPASSVAYLGKPTNDAPGGYTPLGRFHRVRGGLTLFGKPVLELMGTAVDSYTAAIEWPIVKALDQFGKFSGLAPAASDCSHTVPTPVGGQIGGVFSRCGAPSFDFTHAAYRSRYAAFRPRMLVDASGRLRINSLTAGEHRLYERYGPGPLPPGGEYKAISDAIYLYGKVRLPLVSIGSYLETRDLYVFPGNDFQLLQKAGTAYGLSSNYLSFGSAHTALSTHKQPKTPTGSLYEGSILTDVNTDANLMTALICRADGLKPKSVCGRSVIVKILKHVK